MKSQYPQSAQNFYTNTEASVFRLIFSKLAMLNLVHSVLSVLFVGCVSVILGILAESQHEIDILNQGGSEALASYHAMLHALSLDSMFDCVILAVQWRMPSLGGNLEVLGLFTCYVGAPVVLLSLMASRHFLKIAPKQYLGFPSAA